MAINDDSRKKVTELINDAKIGMLTTMTASGDHHSRPMALQATEFDGDLWFFAYDNSNKVKDVQAQPAVNVAFANKGANSWVSIAGTAEIVHDHDKANELWNPLLKAWFPDGVDTTGLALIKVHANSAEYWDSPNNTAIQLFGMAKAALTGTPPKAGDNAATDLA